MLDKKSEKESTEKQKSRKSTGLLLASGLITGEALMGVLVAVAAVSMQGMIPFVNNFSAAGWLGVIVSVAVIYYVYRKVSKA